MLVANMEKLQVIFRVDASLEIGTGHVMRCLTLANLLSRKGVDCFFVCRMHVGNMINVIRRHGYFVYTLQSAINEGSLGEDNNEKKLTHAHWLDVNWRKDATETIGIIGGKVFDWLVVDHYALDIRWEKLLRPFCVKLLVIDDLADRSHECDVLLDQNLGRSPIEYSNLVDIKCKKLIGPSFALLRPEFANRRASSNRIQTQNSIRNILISLGGVDKDNISGAVLNALRSCELPNEVCLTVVLGEKAPWLESLRKQSLTMPWSTRILHDVKDMASLMDEADLAIGAAGGSAWERCCMGLPTILVVLAENQKRGALALELSGAAVLLSDVFEISELLKKQISLLKLGRQLKFMSNAAESICDGLGANRVASVMLYLSYGKLDLRQAKNSDARLLYHWANDPTTRKNAVNSKPIRWCTHKSWFQERLANPKDCQIFIAKLSNLMPLGQVRFDRSTTNTWFIDYSLAYEFRGIGFGRLLLQAAIKFFEKSFPNAVILGKVKIKNIPSQLVFESLGFHRDANLEDSLIVYRRNILDVC